MTSEYDSHLLFASITHISGSVLQTINDQLPINFSRRISRGLYTRFRTDIDSHIFSKNIKQVRQKPSSFWLIVAPTSEFSLVCLKISHVEHLDANHLQCLGPIKSKTLPS